MYYDPIKDRLGRLFGAHPLLRKAFYVLLHLVFLRAWYVRRTLKELIGDVPASRRVDVLDAGTGFGQYAYYVAAQFPNAHVLAVDVKADYLVEARRFVETTPLRDRISFQECDLTELDVDGTFDLIVSVDVMEHIEDDRRVFDNFARVLKKGGHVLVNTPSDQGGSDVGEAGEEGFIEEHVRPGYNLDELCDKLREAGLEPVRALYTYGVYGSRAWRLLVKWPMQMLSRNRLVFPLLPLYYVAALPIGSLLNALDVRARNESGTGLLVVARK